jgi:fatty acid desaturase
MTAVTTSHQRPPGGGSDYAELTRRVKQAGLLDRRPGYYLVAITGTAAFYAVGWIAFFWVGDSWLQVPVAVFLAAAFTQVGFLGHDTGHRQIFDRNRAHDRLGLVAGNLLVGFSYAWWLGKHNRHHAHPNEEGKDPDIGETAIAFLEKHAEARRGVGRLLARCQAYLFFPMLLLEAASLHVSSIRAVARGDVKSPVVEAVLLATHFLAYGAALLSVLSPAKALMFLAVHQGVLGLYLGCSFAPNHKGMPIVTDNDRLDYLRRQVLTSRNIRGNWWTDLFFGGLNYQIEHHLFPHMPRPNLRGAQHIIRAFCRERGIPYTETTLMDSYVHVLRHLHRVGAAARR